jgi:uncharacterized protein
MVLHLKWVLGFVLALSWTLFVQAQLVAPVLKFKKQKIEITYKKQKQIINAELAETPEQHSQGLMFRKKMGSNDGMLFVFKDEQIRDFWMKNTLIDLDIGYFDKDRKLIDIQQMKAVTSVMQDNLPTYPSKRPAQYALEMNTGWFKKNKIEEGSTLSIPARP